jgi:hypothetical protein
METIEDPQYGSLAAKYQLLEMARLNHTLRKCGVAERSVRYRICSEYFFPHGLLLDSDGDAITYREKRLHPVLCFAERQAHTDQSGTPMRTIHWGNHANLYWQTEASLRLLFDEMKEDFTQLEAELGQTIDWDKKR